jgi:hypothetical protein
MKTTFDWWWRVLHKSGKEAKVREAHRADLSSRAPNLFWFLYGFLVASPPPIRESEKWISQYDRKAHKADQTNVSVRLIPESMLLPSLADNARCVPGAAGVASVTNGREARHSGTTEGGLGLAPDLLVTRLARLSLRSKCPCIP